MPAVAMDYCGSTGTFTLSGTFRKGRFITIPFENVPLTLFVKRCVSPAKQPCSHPFVGAGAPGMPPYSSGSDYCSDGTLELVSLSTDCSGAYTVTVSGCVLAVALAVGNWISNPDFSCEAPPGFVDPGSTDYLPFIPDPSTQKRYGCPIDIGGEGTAISSGLGDIYSSETGGITDAASDSDVCGYVPPVAICLPCSATTGAFYATRPLPLTVVRPGDGTIQYQAQPLNGSYTLDFWDNFYSAGLLAYYRLDGQNYMVSGVQVHLTDGCGLTETVSTAAWPSFAPISVIDWSNIVSVTISNWGEDCSPPLYTVFAGPDGPLFVSGPLTGPPGPALPGYDAQIYPILQDLTNLCIGSAVKLAVEIQTCSGEVPDRLQADSNNNLIAISWISGGALKSACHRSPSKSIGNSTTGWENSDTIEASGTDDIGMAFLPNDTLYLTYLLSGTAKYRTNGSQGENGQWSTALTPSPAVARHSASGRGQSQAFRIRALGSQVVNGTLEFSQCRDNRGETWTSPTTIIGTAQGPYCGAIWLGSKIGVLFSLAQAVGGLGAAGDLFWTVSSDGGVTWSIPVFTGYAGQCSSIAKTSQSILVAAIWGISGGEDTAFLQSRNNGDGWSHDFRYGRSAPALTKPPVLTAIEDTVYCLWVSGETPQFLASSDGGVTWE